MMHHLKWTCVVFLMSVLVLGCDDFDVDDIIGGGNNHHDTEQTDSDQDTDVGMLDGVDILLVVDNSGSMAEEQQILSTGVFTLIGSLVNPVSSWPYPAVDSVRVGITTSNMGLQYGWDRVESDQQIGSSCNGSGDDGDLVGQLDGLTSIDIADEAIACEPGNLQCPPDFGCNSNGLCEAPSGDTSVHCPSVPQGYIESSDRLALKVACVAQQGTSGCGVEQQLSAATRALEKNTSFLVETHALQVIMVTDEEDCSIEDPALFETEEWLSGAANLLNVACNISEENEANLFSSSDLRSAILSAKGNRVEDVFFAAIVGVPTDNICQGSGGEIDGCLDASAMEMNVETFKDPAQGVQYNHFSPACTRTVDDLDVTVARPGRRFVETAQLFGEKGYVYSICNADWSPAMADIAEALAARIDE